ncbi:MAG: DUF4956 domain-containing protein [Gemmataceae bacterium]
MSEWFQAAFDTESGFPVHILALRLSVALVLGCMVAGIYRVTHGRDAQSTSLMATLVLLTLLIALITLVIGNNVARAFSLVGALAIVRFRTVVEDTRDTAFVIFAVAIGMAVGAGYLNVPLIAIPLTALAAFLFRPPPARLAPGSPREFTLTVRLGAGHSPDALLDVALGKHLERYRLTSIATARQGAAIDLTYAVALRADEQPTALVMELNRLEGVQSVELN